VLAFLGPSWLWSPLHRIAQAVCLAIFLWLFLYVAWPYTARPAAVWPGWLPIEVDAATGRATITAEEPPSEPLATDRLVHVTDAGLQENAYLGPFRIVRAEAKELRIEPARPLAAEAMDALSVSFGPWTLSAAAPGEWPSHYADDLIAKEKLDAESFLVLDPLAVVSAALAARTWTWSLSCAAAVLLVCLLVPRGFCGYICPLGTIIDLFDWAVGKRVIRWRVRDDGWWVHLKYYLLAAVLGAALFGLLLSGFLAAIPLVTRAMAFLLKPLETGLERGWHQIPAMTAGQAVSVGLFALVLLVGLVKPRFWCKYVCPTGALFSVANVFRLTQRKVKSSCIHCTRCVQACPFDAIKADFTTRTADCTFCQTCGGVCPVGAIDFVGRFSGGDLKPADKSFVVPPSGGRRPAEAGTTNVGRRGFLASGIGLASGALAGAAVAMLSSAARRGASAASLAPLVRPPGSVPEPHFTSLCVRCGECLQACPNDVLQPVGLQRGIEDAWTPQVVADWSGCEPSCNNCGQVCPTGAIRAIPLEEKRVARMGLAVVDPATCLPYAGREDCRLCVDECAASGYDAIEFVRVGTQTDDAGTPIEDSGFLAPVVLEEKCVGCGLCQTRCYAINAKAKGLIKKSAVVVEAGDGREDRLFGGSYVALRRQEQRRRQEQEKRIGGSGSDPGYLPDFLK
jgi:ferredoxin